MIRDTNIVEAKLMIKQKQKSFLNLYEPIHIRFERFCRARVYGDMEFTDLINETLLIAFNKFESLKSEKAFLSYLCTISIRILANNAKKKKPENFNGKEEMNFNIQDVNAQTDSDTDVYYLYKALAMLPDVQKEAIILFELTGFNIKEIMEIQGASESSVKQRLRRGRMKLKEILEFESAYKRGEAVE